MQAAIGEAQVSTVHRDESAIVFAHRLAFEKWRIVLAPSSTQELGNGFSRLRRVPARHGRCLDVRPTDEPPVLRPGSRTESGEPRRRIQNEGHEQQPEPEHPRIRIAREELAKQDVEQRPEGRAQESARAADDGQGDDLAGKGDVDCVGRHDRLEEREQAPCHADDRGRDNERGELVVAHGVAGKERALLVLADRDQHAAERRAHDSQQRPGDGEDHERG